MLLRRNNKLLFLFILLISSCKSFEKISNATTIQVAEGWAGNSINTTIFRKNSIVSNQNFQYTAFYDQDGYIVIGKRQLNSSKFEVKKTKLHGDIKDAHKVISIILDGDDYLHIAWGMHNEKLLYSKSTSPNTIEFEENSAMTGKNETKVTYPEFYKLSNGNILFLYRDGGSGNGNLIINNYNLATKKWNQIQSNLIDGENTRNAYWQACTDKIGQIHLSWVWRESPDVASNHDLCYAVSNDGGISWYNSKKEKYKLPITEKSAEKIASIAEKSELINQTSMTTDENNQPIISTYWKDTADKAPQYHIIFLNNGKWYIKNLQFRHLDFSLSGYGTKNIPISRPQILSWNKNSFALLFRDEERKNRISIATTKDIFKNSWAIKDITNYSVGAWEPTYDTELWKNNSVLNVFAQKVEQIDGEGLSNTVPTMIHILKWKP